MREGEGGKNFDAVERKWCESGDDRSRNLGFDVRHITRAMRRNVLY